jgi:hypothetical protein
MRRDREVSHACVAVQHAVVQYVLLPSTVRKYSALCPYYTLEF